MTDSMSSGVGDAEHVLKHFATSLEDICGGGECRRELELRKKCDAARFLATRTEARFEEVRRARYSPLSIHGKMWLLSKTVETA